MGLQQNIHFDTAPNKLFLGEQKIKGREVCLARIEINFVLFLSILLVRLTDLLIFGALISK